jgi:hypothetical protein
MAEYGMGILAQLHVIDIGPDHVFGDGFEPTPVISAKAQRLAPELVGDRDRPNYVFGIAASGDCNDEILRHRHILELLGEDVGIRHVVGISRYHTDIVQQTSPAKWLTSSQWYHHLVPVVYEVQCRHGATTIAERDDLAFLSPSSPNKLNSAVEFPAVETFETPNESAQVHG